MTHRRAHVWAMGMILGGLAMSLAGNFQAINLDGGRPGIGAYVSAFIWPSFLFGVIEVMLHTPWLSSWRDRLTKGGALVLVAFVAAWISYWHLQHVMKAYGYDTVASHTGPLAVDIGMVLATLALDRVRKAQDEPMANEDGYVANDRTVPEALATAAELAKKELDSVANSTDLAIGQAGQDLASETERWLATGQAGRPAPYVPGGQVAKPAREVIIPVLAIEAIKEWLANPAGLTKGQLDEKLAAQFNVSPRQARRWRAEVTKPQGEGNDVPDQE